jgi:2-methylcitrate dehydratase PrpD
MKTTTVQEISRLLSTLRTEDIPEPALDRAAWCVLDLLGAAMAGFGQESARAARNFGRRFFPAGPAGIWFTPVPVSHPGAA